MSQPPELQVELDSGDRQCLAAADRSGSLADLLASGGLPLNTRCGQRGLCRGCEVELRSGSLETDDGVVRGPAAVKACCARFSVPASIYIPSRSRIEHRPHVTETFEITVPYAHQPLFVPVPGIRDTAFAVDVGTTTVVAMLVDMVTGEVLARASAFNEQIRFGDNVLTRIEVAARPGQLAVLQRAIVAETLEPLLRLACNRAGRAPSRILGGAVAGNTTMLHLLLGEDPSPLGVAPFTPRFVSARQVSAADLGLHVEGVKSETPIQLLPCIAAYIGADITAGVFSSGMVFDPMPSLLVDIGTNGEIVLQHSGKLYGCATAAGPAFEGCGLRCGTRAREGAVSDLSLQLRPFELRAETIGQAPLTRANGICGSAYVAFLATARTSGLLGTAGRFNSAGWESVPHRFRHMSEGERALRLCDGDGADALRISELDVALLLQAKAAIGAGIEILLEAAGLRAAELGRVYLAGGFGMHLNVQHAITIGLLPGFREDQVHVVGNSSLGGATVALTDRTTIDEMEHLREQVEVIELNLAEGFEDRYVEHLTLP